MAVGLRASANDPGTSPRSIGEGLGNVASGDDRAIMVAMAAANLFGAVHALMPGHGKIDLISYHLGQPSRPRTRSRTERRRSGMRSGLMPVYVHGTTAPIDNHVPEVWLSGDRNHANGRLRDLLRV